MVSDGRRGEFLQIFPFPSQTSALGSCCSQRSLDSEERVMKKFSELQHQEEKSAGFIQLAILKIQPKI